jgi:hypothetical protein
MQLRMSRRSRVLAVAATLGVISWGTPASALVHVSASALQTPAAADFAASCPGVSVGPATTVVSDATRDRLGLNGWPDTAFGVLRGDDGHYSFIAPGFGSGRYPPQDVVVTHGTLDDPVADGVAGRGPVEGMPPGYTWAGGGPVYRDPATGTVLQVLHLEQPLPNNRFYATLHLGRVDPSGRVHYLGPIASPEISYKSAQDLDWTADIGTSSLTVAGDQLYVYFADYRLDSSKTSVAATGLSVARAPLADVLAAARTGQVVPWHKYHDGAWDSPALGGASTDLRSGRNPWGPHVVRMASGAYLMAAGASPREMVLSTSSDGLNSWSAEVPLFRDPQRWVMYPTLVGLGPDPSVIGNQFYLYYSEFENTNPDWSNATVKRRLITCTAGRAARPVPLVRYAGADGRHRVTTGPVSDPGAYPERGGIWYLLNSKAPGTQALYGCRHGDRDYFVSTDPRCEDQANAILQTEGWIYTDPPAAPSTALYRCYFPKTGDHMVSANAGCESAQAVNEGLLGYALTTSKVVFSRFYDGRERWDTTGQVSSRYAVQQQWLIEGAPKPGTIALYGCWYPTPLGVEHMTSTRQDCEGTSYLRTEGWIYTSPQAGVPSVPLYRCYLPSQYDHFLSATTTCDGVAGAVREGVLGYAETM